MPKKNKKEIYLPFFKEKRDFFIALAESKRLTHAYLFFGDEGVGKFTFATLFTRFLEEGEFLESSTPLIDRYVLSPDEDEKISVDAVRSVKNFLSQRPLKSPRRTVIIRGGEALTREAQAACLKIVEEPPSSALIIIIARTPEALFPPLSSRMLKIYFPRVSRAELEDYLVREQGILPVRARMIAESSHGSVGRAVASIKEKKKKTLGLSATMEETIMALREKDLMGNSALLAKLLRMEEFLMRYNLNERIQEKAYKFLISNSQFSNSRL